MMHMKAAESYPETSQYTKEHNKRGSTEKKTLKIIRTSVLSGFG